MPSAFQAARLRKTAEYRAIYAVSRKHHAASFSYFYREGSALPIATDGSESSAAYPRFGITVPRALGKAVLRNRIKRRVRVAAREALPLLPAGADVVLHPRPVVATMEWPALLSELEGIFRVVTRRIASREDNTPRPREPRGKSSKSRANKPAAPAGSRA